MASPYNRAAAFVEYSKGTSLEGISFALAIPMDHLLRWSREERWATLVPKIGAGAVARTDVGHPEGNAERAMEKIKANREKNLEIARGLQEDLVEVIQKLRANNLKVKRVFANGTSVELEPSLRDRCDLALYAKNVAEMSYRALGDVESSAKNTPTEGLPASAGQITIVLPAPIAAPREARAFDIESEVVRLDPPALVSETTCGDSKTDSPPN